MHPRSKRVGEARRPRPRAGAGQPPHHVVWGIPPPRLLCCGQTTDISSSPRAHFAGAGTSCLPAPERVCSPPETSAGTGYRPPAVSADPPPHSQPGREQLGRIPECQARACPCVNSTWKPGPWAEPPGPEMGLEGHTAFWGHITSPSRKRATDTSLPRPSSPELRRRTLRWSTPYHPPLHFFCLVPQEQETWPQGQASLLGHRAGAIVPGSPRGTLGSNGLRPSGGHHGGACCPLDLPGHRTARVGPERPGTRTDGWAGCGTFQRRGEGGPHFQSQFIHKWVRGGQPRTEERKGHVSTSCHQPQLLSGHGCWWTVRGRPGCSSRRCVLPRHLPQGLFPPVAIPGWGSPRASPPRLGLIPSGTLLPLPASSPWCWPGGFGEWVLTLPGRLHPGGCGVYVPVESSELTNDTHPLEVLQLQGGGRGAPGVRAAGGGQEGGGRSEGQQVRRGRGSGGGRRSEGRRPGERAGQRAQTPRGDTLRRASRCRVRKAVKPRIDGREEGQRRLRPPGGWARGPGSPPGPSGAPAAGQAGGADSLRTPAGRGQPPAAATKAR